MASLGRRLKPGACGADEKTHAETLCPKSSLLVKGILSGVNVRDLIEQ
jgi:hypothetical protein